MTDATYRRDVVRQLRDSGREDWAYAVAHRLIHPEEAMRYIDVCSAGKVILRMPRTRRFYHPTTGDTRIIDQIGKVILVTQNGKLPPEKHTYSAVVLASEVRQEIIQVWQQAGFQEGEPSPVQPPPAQPPPIRLFTWEEDE